MNPEPDTAFEISLRPPMFSEFTGQGKVRERLELMVEAAKKRGDVLEHILLSGPPGLGKTTLAYIIADAMGVNIKNTSGPVIEKAGELAGLLRGALAELLRAVRDDEPRCVAEGDERTPRVGPRLRLAPA